MARSITLRKSHYTVFLDEVVEEVELPVNPQDPESPLEKRMEPQLKAFEVKDGEATEGTTFKLASMPLQQALNAGKLARKGEGAEAAYKALQRSLTGWTALHDEEGEEVKFQTKLIEFLSVDEAMALAAFIMGKVAGSTNKPRRMVGNV